MECEDAARIRPARRPGAGDREGQRDPGELPLVSAMHITAAIYAELNGPRPKRVVVKIIGE